MLARAQSRQLTFDTARARCGNLVREVTRRRIVHLRRPSLFQQTLIRLIPRWKLGRFLRPVGNRRFVAPAEQLGHGAAMRASDAVRAHRCVVPPHRQCPEDISRLAHQRAAETIWTLADVLVLPTNATTYRLREVIAEPFALNSNLGLYTNFVNLLDMSAVALPAGFRDNATAFGISLIGPAWADRALLDVARRYEEIAPMPEPPMIDTAGVKPSVQLAVVGAHLAAMPLHWQLTSRDARLVRRCKTAAAYRLYAMAGSTPPKPAQSASR